MTSYAECEHCHTRLLIVRGVPPLNYGQDPAGKVAVSIDDPRRGRFLGRDETPASLEHRHSVHECDGQKRAAQRGKWQSAQAQHGRRHRQARGRRPERPVQPGMLRARPEGEK